VQIAWLETMSFTLKVKKRIIEKKYVFLYKIYIYRIVIHKGALWAIPM
jgi:hypothetical protein